MRLPPSLPSPPSLAAAVERDPYTRTHPPRALQLRSAPTSPPRTAVPGRAAPARAATSLRPGRRHPARGGRAPPRTPPRRTHARQRCPCRPPQQPRRSRRRPQARGDPAAAALGRPCGGAGVGSVSASPAPRPSLRGAGERPGRPPRQAGVGCIMPGPVAAPSLWFCSPAGASRGRRRRLPPASAQPPAGLPGAGTSPPVGSRHRPDRPRAPAAPGAPPAPPPARAGARRFVPSSRRSQRAAASATRAMTEPRPHILAGPRQGRSALTSAQRGAPHSRCPARTAHRRGFRLRSAPPGRAGLRGRARPRHRSAPPHGPPAPRAAPAGGAAAEGCVVAPGSARQRRAWSGWPGQSPALSGCLPGPLISSSYKLPGIYCFTLFPSLTLPGVSEKTPHLQV